MGNSIRKNIELSYLCIQLIPYEKRVKLFKDYTIETDYIINSLKYFNIIDKVTTRREINKMIDDSEIILETKKKIHKYLLDNNINIKDITFQKLKEHFKDINEYILYRAFLYNKYIPSRKTFTCEPDKLNFKKILKNLFILDEETSKKYTNEQLCRWFGKIEDDNEIIDILGLTVDKNEKKKEKEISIDIEEIETLISEDKEIKKDKKKETIINIEKNEDEKKCGPRNTKNNPAYTRNEILEIILKNIGKFNLSRSSVMKMNKENLCIYLDKLKGLDKDKLNKEKLDKEHLSPNIDEFLIQDLEKDKIKNCYEAYASDVVLKDYQIRVAKHMLTHRGLLAIHGTGTGKTLTAVASMNCIMKNYPKMNVIIITPTSLISNFKKEMKKFGLNIDKPELRDRIRFYSFKEFVIDIHTNKKNFNICKENFVIIDEAHNLRNLESKKKGSDSSKFKKSPPGINSATILQCIKSASKVLLLTATPLQNRISDIDSLIAMIDGTDVEHLPEDYTIYDIEKKFKCKISINPGNKKGSDYPIRIDKPKEETTFVMSPEYYKGYYDVQEKTGESFEKYGEKSNMFYNIVRRASLSLDDEKSPKVKWTFNKVKEEYNNNRKSVIYTAWKESGVFKVRKLLDMAKIPYGIISGELTKNQRDMMRDAFNNDKIKILIITRAGGEGLDLKGTNNVILMEPNWNKEMDEQIIGRAIRYSSHAHLPEKLRYTNVYKLYMNKPVKKFKDDKLPSADEILYKISYEKKEPVISEFMKLLEKYSIEKVNCDKCCKVKKLNNKSITDSEFFEYYKLKKSDKKEINKDKKETKEKKSKKEYIPPSDMEETYLYNLKKKVKSSKSKLKKLMSKF
jgi:superfamily II DNA or RNA helicase